ncbi:hypothetical protein LCGC14_1162970 [marine sediment metagenome]|uniref:Bacterial bifunctional deaminase-reductase C-terminal domain-containing protein n=1 Tax=marine sediment metagenome TaxID=412755 RepID=A0A0F9LS07_9ZZZZ|nr:MAG: 5-amino-6-(5-phosphoribosylamino)uracil reductase [Candidatus Lokiarchaeum sp. GC14_75]
MGRPKIYVYVTASLDGRISLAPNLTLSNADKINIIIKKYPRFCNLFGDWKAFEDEIKEIYKPDTFMEGSNMVMFEGQEIERLPKYNEYSEDLFQDYLPIEIVKHPKRKFWLAIVDGKGRIRYGYKGNEDNEQSHILHLVSHNVAPEYLVFLQKCRIPYLISGKERVDLKKILSKMYHKLNIKNILTTSAGKLSGALIREDLIDEIIVLINPVIIGGFKTPILFASPELNPPTILPSKLKLISSKVNDDGSILVRYKVISNLENK